MEYKQFETFQNVSLKELQEKHKFLKKLQEKQNLNKNLLNSSINELKSSKKQHTQNLKNNKVQIVKKLNFILMMKELLKYLLILWWKTLQCMSESGKK